MALTARLSDNKLNVLFTEHLLGPVLIKGSVNKMNITINIEKYCSNTKRSSMD